MPPVMNNINDDAFKQKMFITIQSIKKSQSMLIKKSQSMLIKAKPVDMTDYYNINVDADEFYFVSVATVDFINHVGEVWKIKYCGDTRACIAVFITDNTDTVCKYKSYTLTDIYDNKICDYNYGIIEITDDTKGPYYLNVVLDPKKCSEDELMFNPGNLYIRAKKLE